MRVLLDTNVLIWAPIEPDKLSKGAQLVINDERNAFLFSPISIWEIAIKYALGRPDFQLRPDVVLHAARVAGLEELTVTSDAAIRAAALPRHHGDPFDRFLIALSTEYDASLLTTDRALSAYGSSVLLAN